MQLILPHEHYWNAFVDCLAEFNTNPAPFGSRVTQRDLTTFDAYKTQTENARNGINLPDGHVPYTELWLVDDTAVLGVFVIRHTLTPELRQYKGHLGYAIRPTQRNKGLGHKGLALCLDYAHDILGLEKVMISCHAENTASYRLMTAARIDRSGVDEPDIVAPDGNTYKRVWLNTKSRMGKIRPLAVAVIKRGDKVFAVKGFDDVKQEVFYRLAGGGIEFGETGATTIEREFMEEFGMPVMHIQLSHAVENIFTFNGKPGHEIVLVYTADLPPEYDGQETFPFVEEGRESLYGEFVDPKAVRLYPFGAIK